MTLGKILYIFFECQRECTPSFFFFFWRCHCKCRGKKIQSDRHCYLEKFTPTEILGTPSMGKAMELWRRWMITGTGGETNGWALDTPQVASWLGSIEFNGEGRGKHTKDERTTESKEQRE